MRKLKNRWMAAMLSLCILVGTLPITAMGVENTQEHIHDDECGYVEGVEGKECSHVHDDKCGYIKEVQGRECSRNEASDKNEKEHIHDDECGYIEGVEGKECSHVHDDKCGYIKEVKAHECSRDKDPGEKVKSGEADLQANRVQSSRNINAVGMPGVPAGDLGYTYDNITGTMTVTTNEGATAWHGTVMEKDIKTLVIGDQVTAIADYAFSGTSNIRSLDMSKCTSLKSIGDYAFYGESGGAAGVKFPPGLESVGEGAFYKCDIKELDLSMCTSLKSIGKSAFRSCNMRNLKLPVSANPISIGEEAFMYNTASEAISISQSVASIGPRAFDNSISAATKITFDPKNNYFSFTDNVLYSKNGEVLYWCLPTKIDSDFKIPSGVKHIAAYAFHRCRDISGVTLPQGLESIGDYVFADVPLKKVHIPASVARIGKAMFSRNMTEITVDPSNKNYVCKDGALYDINMHTLYAYATQAVNVNLQIPSSVKRIEDSAFASCQALASVDMSGCTSLKSIGESAFEECYNLTKVDFPMGLESIGDKAFGSCTSFKHLDLSGRTSLKSIRDGAFHDSKSTWLESIDLSGCSSLTNIGKLFSVPAGSVDANTIKRVNLSGCTSLASIEERAFYMCPNLEVLDMSGCTSLKSIGDGAFISTNKLEILKFPPGLESIGKEVFTNSHKLTNLDFPAGLKTIGYGSFGGCTDLVRVNFPAGLESINNGFQDCDNLADIRFAGDVAPSVGTAAFGNTAAAGKVYYPAGVSGYAEIISNSGINNNWELIAAYRLTLNRGVDETKGSVYEPGDQVTISANLSPGQTFSSWRGGDDSIFASGSRMDERTTITMPANHVELTAGYVGEHFIHVFGDWQQDETHHWRACTCGEEADRDFHQFGEWTVDREPTETQAGSQHRDCTVCAYRQTEEIAALGEKYLTRTLTHASGVEVNGLFTADAAISVTDSLHPDGGCTVCDGIRIRQEQGEALACYDISLASGKLKDGVTVGIPVGEQYNGQALLMLHCANGKLESRSLTVEKGMVRGEFSSLSPFAVVKESADVASISGLPAEHSMSVGEEISWTPQPRGGAWDYDAAVLELSQDGGSYTFKAIGSGQTTATYTAGGMSYSVALTISQEVTNSPAITTSSETEASVSSGESPKTGDSARALVYMVIGSIALGGMVAGVYGRRKKRS